jgi:hypothetical protein
MGHAENAITRSIMAAIALQGDRASFVRVQAGAIKLGNRVIKMAAAGTADLVGSYRGRAVALEVKTTKGVQRDTQAAWEARWADAGGVYAVVRSAAEVLELFARLDQEINGGIHPPGIS